MTIFFTSDTHYGHFNIIKHAKRPFLVEGETRENYTYKSVDYMTEEMIRRWNSVVTKDDTVYHLGDVSFYNRNDTDSILYRLNGRKILISGNHDSNRVKSSGAWHYVKDYEELRMNLGMIILGHFPFAVWNKSHKGSFNLHGHSHGTFRGSDQQIDVGVDCWDFFPITFEQALSRMRTLPRHKARDRH